MGFFIHYWIPETSAFPANELWLTQLSPLASAALTSEGLPQVQAQNGQWGFRRWCCWSVLSHCFWLSRTRHWLGRTAMLAPAALGLVAALASVIALAVKGEVRSTLVGVALLITWVWSAGYAALHGFLDNLAPTPPKTWHSGLPLLAAYAITARLRQQWVVGCSHLSCATPQQPCRTTRRCDWQPCGRAALRCVHLRTAIGVAVWVAYQAWPPRRDAAFLGRCLIVIGILIVTGAIGWPATTLAEKRVDQLTYASPADEVRFTCGSWILDSRQLFSTQREPVKTLVINGFTCQTVTAFSGYQQLSTHTLPVSLAPVIAHTPEGATISGRIVAAQYGDVPRRAGSDRFDAYANELLASASPTAQSSGATAATMDRPGVRFANVPGGDNPPEGPITQGEVALRSW